MPKPNHHQHLCRWALGLGVGVVTGIALIASPQGVGSQRNEKSGAPESHRPLPTTGPERQQKQQETTNQSSERATSDTRAGKPATSEQQPSPNGTTDSKQGQAAQTDNKPPQNQDWQFVLSATSVIATVVTALAAVASAFAALAIIAVYVGQLWAMRETLNETRKAANAARDSAKTAADSFRLLNRPYVDLGEWHEDGSLDIRNLGYAPAKLQLVHMFVGAAGSEQPRGRRPLAAVIARDGQINVPDVLDEPPMKGTRVVGYVLYRDVMDRPHWRTFGGHLRRYELRFALDTKGMPEYNVEDGSDVMPPPPLVEYVASQQQA